MTASKPQPATGAFFAKAGHANEAGAAGLFFPPAVQAKLTVGKADDKYEREADSMAEQVVQRAAMPDVQTKCAGCEEKEKVQRKPLADGVTPFVQRKEMEREPVQMKEEEEPVQAKLQRKEEEEGEEPVQAKLQRKAEEEEPVQTKLQLKEEEGEEPVQAKLQRKEEEEPVQAKPEKMEEKTVQAKLNNGQRGPSMSEVESVLQSRTGLGNRLPGNVLRTMEAGFGVDLGEVRIHTDNAAVEMSQSLNAQAFTHGWDVYFNQYRYNPATTAGSLLLAHELAHTLQQAKANGQALRPAQTRMEPEIPAAPSEQAAVAAMEQAAAQAAAEISAAKAAEAETVAGTGQSPAEKPAEAPTQPRTQTLPACRPAAPAPAEAQAQDAGAAPPAVVQNQAPLQLAVANPSPKCPAEDPAFRRAHQQVKRDAKKQRKHEPAGQKRDEMVASAALPTTEQNLQSGQEQQAAALESAAQPKPFDRLEFKRKLQLKIESKMPQTEDQAKEFSGSGKLEEAKEEFKGTISEEKGKVSGPLEAKKAEPLPEGQNLKPDNVSVPAAKPADQPGVVPTGFAAPKPRTEEEISLEHKSIALDEQMAQEGLTEQQLAESEEPKFEQALQSKKDAQREIAAAPGQYRQVEEQQLELAQKKADKATGKGLRNMATTKNTKTGDVFTGQKVKESATELRQRQIKTDINRIYTDTETAVTGILTKLSETVESSFATAVEIANETFKSRVRSRLDDHYGWFTFDDKIAEWAGLSDGVAHIFREERERFLTTMDTVLDEIATTVETELNAALQRIQQGRTELENFKNTLSADELKFAEDMLAETMDKFTELESSVNESQDELIETLSDQYVESVNKLQEEFDKINEELSASWIADAISFIGEVATAIKKLGELLSSIASRIGQYISDILASPKRFFNNLVDGLTGGMDQFRENIDTYLEQGFWMWLTGASSARSIQIPEKMDVQGMFSLAAQLLGISMDFILERIKVKLRLPVDAILSLINKAEAAGEKLLEPVQILLTKGVGALWTWVKDEVSSHLEEIFSSIKTEIFHAIIKKFLLWVATLFIPGLGFIKLIQAAYKALRWLVDNIQRIADIVNTFLDAVGLAVMGNVSAIKEKVVKALTLGVVIAIDFLAKLVGLGNFADKLQRLIQKLKKPIQKVIDGLLVRAKPVIRRVQRAIERGVKAVKRGVAAVKQKGRQALDFVIDWWKAEKKFSGNDGKSHRLFFQGKNEKATLMVASVTTSFERFIENLNTNGNARKEAAKQQALPIAALVDSEKVKFPPKGLSADDLKKFYIDRKQTVNKLLNDLSAPVAVLMDGKESAKGTYDQPIPLRWTKRGLVEDLYNLVPIAQRWTSKKKTPPMPIAQANFRKKTWIEIPPTMEEKFPTEETQVREGRPGRFVQIGIDEKYFPKIGKRLERTAGRSDAVKNRFRNSLLPNWGHSFKNTGYDMDHVQDMGMGGEDTIPNLWPLYEGMNRKYGTMIYDQVVTYLGDDNKPKLGTPKGLIGKWFVIETIGDAETG